MVFLLCAFLISMFILRLIIGTCTHSVLELESFNYVFLFPSLVSLCLKIYQNHAVVGCA